MHDVANHVVTSPDGTRIACAKSGSGPPIVLVHGTSGDRWSFRFVEPLLSARFTIHAMDRRGRGGSGDSANRYAIEQEFADVAALVDSLDEPADVLGHSYGATVALGASPLTPNVRRLVLYEPSPGISAIEEEFLARLDSLLADGQREELYSVFMTELAGMSPAQLSEMKASPVWPGRVAAAHTIMREIRAEESYLPEPEDFAGVTAPTLLLLGSESPEWAVRGTEVARSVLSNSRVETLEGHGHVAIVTAPELVTEAVTRFLTEE
jgi:pimeloyl-ACP methyl ester carboxylesterase